MEDISVVYHRYLRFIVAKDDTTATTHDKFMALSLAVRNRMVETWIETQKKYSNENPRRVYFLSTEYDLGKCLHHNIVNMDIESEAIVAAEMLGTSLSELYQQEDEFELGSLSRGGLSATFLEAMATAGLPAMGYGLRYDYGLYQQDIRKGKQVEKPYDWQHKSHPWEVNRQEYSCEVGFGGSFVEQGGTDVVNWTPDEKVKAVPFDFPISGYKNNTVNTLRLWTSEAVEEFGNDYLHHGDYMKACEERAVNGRVTKFLFPDDDVRKASEIMIRQYTFFASASIQDIIRRHKSLGGTVENLPETAAIHLNGSHLAIAVAELMRILIDVENVEWEKAWEITRKVFSYTSHAISKESEEKWPVYILDTISARLSNIIMEINQWHLDVIRDNNNIDNDLIRELSIVQEGDVKWIKMEHLLILASTSICGVSKSQKSLLKNEIYSSILSYAPTQIRAYTSGISLRRWIYCSNKPLANLISEMIGDSWIAFPDKLAKLETFATDDEFITRFLGLKHVAKRKFSKMLREYMGIAVDIDTMFDADLKKVHTCKRQMLHLLYVISQYLRIKSGDEKITNRTHFFGGRATPSDFMAKQIIHLINGVAEIISTDLSVKNKINVVFIPNYNISLSEAIAPAVDLTEELSIANCEPGSTGVIKFGVNGAIPILGSCKGNDNLISELGFENLFVFSENIKENDLISPAEVIEDSQDLKDVFKFLENLVTTIENGQEINPLLSSLKYYDPNLILRNYKDYVKVQSKVDVLYKDRKKWAQTAIKNIAKLGKFSSDKMIDDYIQNVWKIKI